MTEAIAAQADRLSVVEAAALSARHQPLRVVQKITLTTGAAVDGIGNAALANFQFFYLTVVCGLSGSLAGASVAIALTVDAFIDPLIGSLSDNWVSPRGRRHPWMYASIVPVAVALGLMFSAPAHVPVWVLFAYVTVTYIVYRIASSAFTLPYAAMTAEVTDDYVERSVLRIYSTVFATLAGVLVVGLGFGVFLRDQARLAHDAYIPFAWLCALIIAAVGLFCSVGTTGLRERLHAPAASVHAPLLRLLREIGEVFRNRSFRIIFFTAFIWFVALGTAGTPALLSNAYFWRLPNSVIFGAATALTAGGFLGIFASIAIAPKLEKRTVLIGALLIFLALEYALAPLRILGLLPPDGSLLYAIIIAVSLIIGTVGACAGIAFWSMMGDATDEHELLFGARREGLYFSGMTLAAKAAAGAGVLIAGVALDLVGFPHDAATLAHGHLGAWQTNGLGLVTGPLAAAITTPSLILLWGYRIDRKEHARIVAALAGRKHVAMMRG